MEPYTLKNEIRNDINSTFFDISANLFKKFKLNHLNITIDTSKDKVKYLMLKNNNFCCSSTNSTSNKPKSIYNCTTNFRLKRIYKQTNIIQ